MTDRRDRRVLKPGDRIADFIVKKLLGRGGYGDIYHVYSRSEPDKTYAMKLEMTNGTKKSHLYNEKEILLTLQDSQYFPKFIAFGHTALFRYLVEECLGPSLSSFRQLLPKGHFSLSSSLRIGIETLRTIESFHQHGYIHRDIKPSNFLVRASLSAPILLIDYGLAKRYINKETGELIPPRERAGFAGTTKYASLNAHENQELSRRDDIFSWIFSLFEMLTGKLPWASSKDKQDVYEYKIRADIQKFCQDNKLPHQIYDIYELIKKYKFEDEPNYSLIISFLVEAMKENNCSWDDKYEWNMISHDDLLSFSAMTLSPPTNDHPMIPKGLPPPVMPDNGHSSSSSYESNSSSEEFPPLRDYKTHNDMAQSFTVSNTNNSFIKQEAVIERNIAKSGKRRNHKGKVKSCLIY
ncbi:hypothetical protein M9Y10_030812 [Tritrichomonas musculus]|uniref:non-specific serine/threonine protein kinase n=1 Tax=Tritrichomonas musculus TaxID=1915356 RepID=A0ABR2H2H6_9EUKA